MSEPITCPGCKAPGDAQAIAANLRVCPACGYHFRMEPRERIAYLADEGSAYMYHVFGGHAAQCLDVLRDAFEVENLGVFWLASQRVDHRRGIVAYFLVSLRTHY